MGTININGTECETTGFVWHTLMNTVRWWCKSKEWVNLGIEPDDILECDASWYIPVIVRAQVFKKLPGGWSAMLRAILRQLLKFPMRWSPGADRDQPSVWQTAVGCMGC